MTTAPRRLRRRPRLLVAAVAAALAGLLLSGCVSIPTQGPIGTGEVVPVEPGLAIPLADDPEPDASPEQIVAGFLSAGAAGLYDEFAVARKYLTVTAADSWDPRARVLVYPLQGGGPEIQTSEDGTVLATVPVAATVDAAGRYVEAAPGSREEVAFELMLDGAGQWRISGLDDGVLMSSPNFQSLHRRSAVYFVSRDATQLVPEIRWFPTRNPATVAVEALLAGPSPWLRDAVVTGVPEGTRLTTGAVTVVDGVATVDLSAEARRADSWQRRLIQAQLEAVLERVPGTLVSRVEVTVTGVPWDPEGVAGLARDQAPASGPYLLSQDTLALLDGSDVVPLADVAALEGLAARSPAVGYDGVLRVVLAGRDRIMLLPLTAETPTVLVSGTDLLAPSVDRADWVWTGERASGGIFLAVRPGAEPLLIPAEAYDGRQVRSVRVSRDGTRVAVVSAADGDVSVDVSAVVREEDGTPRAVGPAMRVGASLIDATEAVWVDEGTLAVLGTSGALAVPTTHLVPLGGPTEALSIVDGAVGIAAGRSDRALYVVTSEGVLHRRQNTSWLEVAEGVRAVAFPG